MPVFTTMEREGIKTPQMNHGTVVSIENKTFLVTTKQRICDGVYLISARQITEYCGKHFPGIRFFYNKYHPEYLEEFGTKRKLSFSFYEKDEEYQPQYYGAWSK